MALLFYNIFCWLYLLGIKFYSLFNEKAKKWLLGRQGWEHRLRAKKPANEKTIWMHCASLGEFEQGRPLIEALKKQYPQYKIALTFFSPSGYEVQKNYPLADYVLYLPMDSRRNAKRLIAALNPVLVIFVKYEFWYHYLKQLHRRKIPTLLVSAAFRKNQVFFKWYGWLFRKMLKFFNHIFVQDDVSQGLLASIGIANNVSIAGDTRYDRVAMIAKNAVSIEVVEKFKGDCNLLIAGSTWQEEIKYLHLFFAELPHNWKLIIAPHEVQPDNIKEIRELFGLDSVLFSELNRRNPLEGGRVLIIDNIGMLSSLYAYGAIAFVGGGFLKGGIHNILEPAVFGLPIIFGPVYKKFVEANKLVALKYAFPVKTPNAFAAQLLKLVFEDDYRASIHNNLLNYMQQQTGATGIIINWIDGVLVG